MGKRLDKVDKLPVGGGALDFGAFLRGDAHSGIAGGKIDYAHRLSRNSSAYAEAFLGRTWDDAGSRTKYGASAGLRMRW